MTVLVEGFEPDQIALAAHLAAHATTAKALAPGETIRLAGAGPAPPEALALADRLGVLVEPHTDLDADPGLAEVAYLDVWTPEVAPRVRHLRARGTRVTSIGDLLLDRAQGLTVGVTGTAGKTTTASATVQLLRAAAAAHPAHPAHAAHPEHPEHPPSPSDDAADASTTGRLGNLWPTAELLDRPDLHRPLVLELTSSHLAFMQESPAIAVITCFWPDHLELHGSLAAYRAAKETIVRGQRPGDTLVVNADDPGACAFAEHTPAALVEVSLRRPVETGVFVGDGVVMLRHDGVESELVPLASLPFQGPELVDVLLAVATALAAGASPAALRPALPGLVLPAHRSRVLAPTAAPPAEPTAEPTASPTPSPATTPAPAGTAVVDDGMAATPSKTAAGLARYADRSVVLVAGGLDDLGFGPVHATPEEQDLLERACDVVARVARLAVLFGPAAYRLEPLLAARAVPLARAERLDDAVAHALSCLQGASALVFSPMFPVTAADRERFAQLARAGARRGAAAAVQPPQRGGR